MMIETNSSVVETYTTSSPTTPLRVTLALAPDPTRDYTDILRDIVDLAFEASAFMPVEIKIVDPADDELATNDAEMHDVQALQAPYASIDNQTHDFGSSCISMQRPVPRLESRPVAA
jgi:hypothetical protein